jgi:hypothetical protein
MQDSMKALSGLAIAILLMCCAMEKASARCRDSRKTCDFAANCLNYSAQIVDRIREGVRTGSGEAVWDGLNQCASGHPGSRHQPSGRTFDDIANACEPGEFVSIGDAAIQKHDGNAQSCNRFAE